MFYLLISSFPFAVLLASVGPGNGLSPTCRAVGDEDVADECKDRASLIPGTPVARDGGAYRETRTSSAAAPLIHHRQGIEALVSDLFALLPTSGHEDPHLLSPTFPGGSEAKPGREKHLRSS